MTCKICENRRPRRYCPGVGGDICSICCGTEREVTVSCPFDCPHLQDARDHDKLPELGPKQLPNPDVRVTEQFLEDNVFLLTFLGTTLLDAALRTPGAVDSDVREALDSLVRTYRTLQSGLYYETRPTNPLAGNIHQLLQQHLAEFQRQSAERRGVTPFRAAAVLGVLVFLQRLEMGRANGRRRGRAFLDFLRTDLAEPAAPGGASRLSGSAPSLIVP